MILVTVGTHPHGFDRLVAAADRYAAVAGRRVVIQRGASRYRPEHAYTFDFAPAPEIESLSRSAHVVVTHAGAGSLITSLSACANVVAVPRLKKYAEAMDDHQLELASALHEAGRLQMVRDIVELPQVLDGISPQTSADQSLNAVPLLSYLERRLAVLAVRRE